MWVAKRLDMPWRLIFTGLAQTRTGEPQPVAAERLEPLWSRSGNALATLSVRSSFDLFLSATGLPHGSEVLMSGITLDAMRQILVAHGLRPIPLDLDFARLSPNLEQARERLTPRTKAVLIAHLFGGRIDLTPWVEFCREHGLLLIEDCAQAYDGPGYTGHEGATISMFSFGPIKTATALGGALSTVRDAGLLARMRQLQNAWPMQNPAEYRRRLLNYAVLKVATHPTCYRLARWIRRRTSGSSGSSALHNFPGIDLLSEIRHKPCSALLSTLHASLANFDSKTLCQRARAAQQLREVLGESISIPGAANSPHSHWVFPLCAHAPEQFIAALAEQGFDAIHAASMRAIPAPEGSRHLAAPNAEFIAQRLVYLPAYSELTASERVRLAACVRRHLIESTPKDSTGADLAPFMKPRSSLEVRTPRRIAAPS